MEIQSYYLGFLGLRFAKQILQQILKNQPSAAGCRFSAPMEAAMLS